MLSLRTFDSLFDCSLSPIFINCLFLYEGEVMFFSESSAEDQISSLDGQQAIVSTNAPFVLQQRSSSLQPATVYVQSLALGSQRTMKSALVVLVQLMLPEQTITVDVIFSFPWEALRFEHTSILR